LRFSSRDLRKEILTEPTSVSEGSNLAGTEKSKTKRNDIEAKGYDEIRGVKVKVTMLSLSFIKQCNIKLVTFGRKCAGKLL
jgi:hypothetical protein